MAKRKTKRPTLSDQLRQLIERGPMTRYAICKASGINQAHLHRFMHGEARLTTESLDALGHVLRLRFVQDDDE